MLSWEISTRGHVAGGVRVEETHQANLYGFDSLVIEQREAGLWTFLLPLPFVSSTLTVYQGTSMGLA